ncbi:hypothetical protein Taro_040008, partial [Colocasia esculenta]|nr:hypothetical protein [Colocasia esculenta]
QELDGKLVAVKILSEIGVPVLEEDIEKMASDRSWMYRRIVDHVVSVEFSARVETFIQFALGNPNAAVDNEGGISCGPLLRRESLRFSKAQLNVNKVMRVLGQLTKYKPLEAQLGLVLDSESSGNSDESIEYSFSKGSSVGDCAYEGRMESGGLEVLRGLKGSLGLGFLTFVLGSFNNYCHFFWLLLKYWLLLLHILRPISYYC